MTVTAYFDIDAYGCLGRAGEGVTFCIYYKVQADVGKPVIHFTTIAFGSSSQPYLDELGVNVKEWERRLLLYAADSILDEGLDATGMAASKLATEGLSETDFISALQTALRYESSLR